MKSVTGYVVAAIVLALAALVCWRVGNDQLQVAIVHQQVQTMQYAAAAKSDVEQSLGPLARLSPVGGDMAADARAGQSTADYWLGKYDDLKPEMNTSKPAEKDPRVLLLNANAAYRTIQAANQHIDKAALLQQFDQVINGYRDVMRANPDDTDAPYNYELVVRQRSELARQRGPGGKPVLEEASTSTIHGRPGTTPKGQSMSDFKTNIPQRNDERQEERRENENAGKGNQKARKG